MDQPLKQLTDADVDNEAVVAQLETEPHHLASNPAATDYRYFTFFVNPPKYSGKSASSVVDSNHYVNIGTLSYVQQCSNSLAVSMNHLQSIFLLFFKQYLKFQNNFLI